jgi:mRNA (guanine-N7-)-methyltransferase
MNSKIKFVMDEFVKLNINDLVLCIKNNDFKLKDNPKKSVKVEFDKFVNSEISKRRKNSSISLLRTFHNNIKKTLIESISNLYRLTHKPEINCLDIAVGRGGDLYKWNSANIKNVFGFDKSRDSIESINPFNQGAIERYSKSTGLKVNVEFAVGDAVQPTVELINTLSSFMKRNNINGFEIMSCQFALHYFFQSETALRNMFQIFGQFVKKGGYFFGTTVDGKKVTELLGSTSSFNSKLLTITKKFKSINPRKPYGNQYIFKINDSVDQGNYFNTMGESVEYLVNLEQFKAIASEYKFVPVYLNFFEPIPGKNNAYTTSPDFVSFDDIYNLSPKKSLSEEEIPINNLYTTFVFMKM